MKAEEVSKPDDEDIREPSELDTDELYAKLCAWVKDDIEHANAWRKEARIAYDFYAGEQFNEDERAALQQRNRPEVVFNFMGKIVDAVSGAEVNNRQEIRYLPRTMGDTPATDNFTAAGRYFREQSHAEDEESEAFRDAVVSGMGWTETRLDYDDDPEGAYLQERVDPFEMIWDSSAVRSNLVDARRIARARTMSLKEAMLMFPDEDPAMLDASWASGDDKTDSVVTKKPRYQGGHGPDSDLPDEVTIVHVQWKEPATFYRVLDPQTRQTIDLTEEKFAEKTEVLAYVGIKPKKVQKMVVKQAFLGGKMLEIEGQAVRKALSGRFTWKCITGKRDRNKRQWFGLVKAMIDPQRWANKWMSQTLHILNSQAKGGIIAEEGAFQDINAAKDSYARVDEITIAANGAVANQKIMPKPGAQFPQGHFQLMQFAVQSIREVTPVNLELLGQADRDQPGVLEYQRNRQAITGLAALFDSLRRYRKLQGDLMLHIIIDYMSDGRLIRIVGEEGEQYVPLMKAPDIAQFDVIVDDAPSAPNQKEITWSLIQQMPPQIMQAMTPDMWATILEYSPAPASFVEKMKEQIQKAAQAPKPPDPAVMKAQIEEKKAAAQIELKQLEFRQEAQIERERAERDAQIEGAQAASDMAVQREKSALEMRIREREAALDERLALLEHRLKMAELAAGVAAKQQAARVDMATSAVKLEQSRESHQMNMEAKAKAMKAKPKGAK